MAVNKSNTKTKNAVATKNAKTDPLANEAYRRHGMMAAKKWEAAERSGMVGDALFALALAEYMESKDKLLVVVVDRKGIEQSRHMVKLSERDKMQQEWAKERNKLTALNTAIFDVIVYGSQGPVNNETTAVYKAHLQRAYPAAMQLRKRALELGVKLSDAITVHDDGRITIKEFIADGTKELPKTEDEMALTRNLPLQVKTLGEQYVEAHPAPAPAPREPHGHTSETPKTDTPKTADERVKEARALTAKQFVDACGIILQRLNDLTHKQPTATTLEGPELDKLARLSKAVGLYEAMRRKEAEANNAKADAKADIAKERSFGKMAADGRNH